MTRTETREYTFELLYSLEIQKIQQDEYKDQIEMFLKEQEIKNQKVREYMIETTEGIYKNEKEILELISNNLSEKWNITRISKVNITLLKLATYEIIYAKLPYKVVVNEVVEIAKKYGDDNSASFINGILANIIKKSGITNEE